MQMRSQLKEQSYPVLSMARARPRLLSVLRIMALAITQQSAAETIGTVAQS